MTVRGLKEENRLLYTVPSKRILYIMLKKKLALRLN